MKKSLFKNIIYKILLNVFNLILPILVGPYVNRVLGAHSIGRVQVSETIYTYFLIFATFGVYQYGLRELSRIRDDKQKVSQLFTSLYTISTVTGVIAMLCYLAFSYFKFSSSIYYPVLLIYSLNFISYIFYVEWVNEAMENYDFITIKTIIVRVIYVVLIFLFVRSTRDYQHYALLLVLSMFLNNLISFVFIKRKVKFDFTHIQIKKHLKPMFLVVIFSNAAVLFTQLDRYMLGVYVGAKAESYYVIPQQIMGIVSALMLSVVQVTIPRLSNILGSNDEKSYLILLNNISKLYFSLLFPASLGLYILSDVAIMIYGGKGFLAGIPALSMFAFYMIVTGIDSIFSNQIIYVKKKEHILVRLIFLSGLTNLVFKIILLKLGILTPRNAMLTTTIAYGLLIALEYGYIRRFLKVPYQFFDFGKLKYLLYSLLFIPVSFGIRHYFSGPIPLFIGIVGANAVIYAGILILTKDFVYQMFIGKIKGRFGRA